VLKWRLIGSIAIVAPLCGLCWLDFQHNFGRPGIWLFPIVPVLGVLAAEELLRLLRTQHLRPLGISCHVATLLVILVAGIPIWWPTDSIPIRGGTADWIMYAMAIGVLMGIVGELRRYKEPGHSMVHLALTVFTIFYVGGLLSYIIRLRLIEPDSPNQNGLGMLALLSMIVVVKLTDTGAYFVGSSLGRTKIVPLLSPGKTAEGLLGGFLFACAGSYLMFQLVGPWLFGIDAVGGNWGWLGFASLVSPASMLGDLAESMFKRDMGTKDSSTWMVGLGGILDVLDSMLVGAPVALFCWEMGILSSNS